MRRVLPGLLFVAALAPFACKHGDGGDGGADIKTDLGPGNAEVVANVEAYRAKAAAAHCAKKGERRIIITGFGLFSGADYNISGVVASSLAKEDFWPDEADLEQDKSTAGGVSLGSLQSGDSGARAVQRTLTFRADGGKTVRTYEICFMLLDVLWDEASAEIIAEAERFQPQLIIMSGRGGDDHAIFEGGAINKTYNLSGYGASGDPDTINKPVKGYLLPENLTNLPQEELQTISAEIAQSYVVPDEIKMTWNNVAMRAAAMPEIAKIGFDVKAEPKARSTNSYICNNTSYIVLNALAGLKILPLAGEKLVLRPDVPPGTKAGFFHYPYSATNDPDKVYGWGKALARAIMATL